MIFRKEKRDEKESYYIYGLFNYIDECCFGGPHQGD